MGIGRSGIRQRGFPPVGVGMDLCVRPNTPCPTPFPLSFREERGILPPDPSRRDGASVTVSKFEEELHVVSQSFLSLVTLIELIQDPFFFRQRLKPGSRPRSAGSLSPSTGRSISANDVLWAPPSIRYIRRNHKRLVRRFSYVVSSHAGRYRTMAKKKMTKQQTRKMRAQQIIFAIIAIIMIASFIVSMIS